MSKASEFDVDFYLLQNSDVTEAVENGEFSDGLQHFNFFGSEELRAPNELFDPVFYLSENPDVAASVSDGNFENSFQHYQSYGETENRAPNEGFLGFNARSYLDENTDVAFAVENGCVIVTDKPGWGININPDWLKSANYHISEIN